MVREPWSLFCSFPWLPSETRRVPKPSWTTQNNLDFFFKGPVSWLSRQWRWLCKPADLRSSYEPMQRWRRDPAPRSYPLITSHMLWHVHPHTEINNNHRSRLACELQRARCWVTRHGSQGTSLNGTSKEVLEAWLMTTT